MTRDDVIDMKLAYSRGEPIEAIAKRFRVSRNTVYNRCLPGRSKIDIDLYVTARKERANHGSPRDRMREAPCRKCGGARTIPSQCRRNKSGITMRCGTCSDRSRRLSAARARRDADRETLPHEMRVTLAERDLMHAEMRVRRAIEARDEAKRRLNDVVFGGTH